MIDEEKTYAEKWYRSNELKSKSHKPVYAVCEGEDCQREGGRGRWVEFCNCVELCHLCATRTEEFRRKHRDYRKGMKASEDSIQKMRESGKRENLSEETLLKMSFASSGESNGNWKGGISTLDNIFRSSDIYAKWRISVFERDDYTCQECGDRGGITLNAHHILPYSDWREPRFSLNIKNGIALCEDCHRETFGKEYEFFNKYFDIANGVGKHNN